MRAWSRLRSWLRATGGRTRLEREMAEEMRFHLDAYAADLMAAGVPPAEARRRARLEFGAIDARKEEVRQALGLRLLDELRADVRYALRQLRRSPGFTTVAVLSLALGIGANTAIFSLMEAALWSPIPVERPEELRLFSWVSGHDRVMNGIDGNMTETPEGGFTSTSFSDPIFRAFEQETGALDAIFAFKPVDRVTALIDGSPEVVEAVLVSGRFYEGTGVTPPIGRPLGPEDDRVGAPATAVISDEFWARRFSRDPAVVGAAIAINGIPLTIVGVNPPHFTGLRPGTKPDVFMALRQQPAVWPQRDENPSWLDAPDVWWLLVMGRVDGDVTPSRAEAMLDAVLQRSVRASLPDRLNRDQPRLVLEDGSRGLDFLTGRFATPLFVLLALVGVVLLIACANVASLLLARAAARQREVSLRLALGAGRWRVARQLLTEGLTLAVLAGAVGILLGYWLRDAVPGLLAPSWERGPFQAAFNWRVVALTVAATTTTGVLFSLAPAWRSASQDINGALKAAGHATGGVPRWWHGKLLVVCQVGLSILLVTGAGLFVRTLWNLQTVELGFEPKRLLLFVLDPPRTGGADGNRNLALDQLHMRIAAVPGVERATLMSNRPLGNGGSQTGATTDLAAPPEEWAFAWVNDVGRDYFETMGIPLLAGRAFSSLDGATSPRIAVVNAQFAQEHFPGENPVGRTFRNGGRILTVVGVVGDASYASVRRPKPPTFYRLYEQEEAYDLGAMTFAVRTAAAGLGVVPAIRAAVGTVDRDLPVFDVRTMDDQIAANVSQERLFVTLSTVFALVAVTLAAIGLYGILAHMVIRRTGEIGIRLALGALRGRVLRMILREAAVVAAVGVVVGLAAAVGLTRFIQGMLFGVEPIDVPTFAAAVTLMVAIVLLVGWLPARRAARLEPMQALRHE